MRITTFLDAYNSTPFIGRARPKSTHDTRNEGMRMQCLLVHDLN